MPRGDLRKFYKKTSVLIPGGAGFIGSGIARQLARLGARVTIVDSFDPLCGANRFNIKAVSGKSVLIKKKIEDFLLSADLKKYDIIFNCIGLTNHHIGQRDIGLDYRINCLAGLRLMEKLAAQKSGCRMISIGSRNQYGMSPSSGPIDESHPMRPVDVQAIHKVALEQYNDAFRARYGLNLLYIRLTNVYGPGQRLNGEGVGVIGEMIRGGMETKELIIYGSASRIKDILFIDDAVNALLLLGAAGKTNFTVYNLGGRPCALRELADSIKRYHKVKAKVVPFPDAIKKIDTGDAVLRTDRIRKETGWAPATGIEEGMGRTLDYYKKYKNYYLT